MFDDFSKEHTSAVARKRLRRSIAGAAVIYALAGAAVVGATATASQVVQEEELTQISFAPAPEPPASDPPEVEAAPPPKPAKPRPALKREIRAPDEVPREKAKESDAALAEAGETGPVDGFLDGVEGGTGTDRVHAPAPPPPPRPEKITPPFELNNEQPKYPKAALRKGIEGVVVVAFDVLESGACTNPKIVSGPAELHDVVLRAVASWRYRPALLGTKKIRRRTTKRVVFKLEDR
jgi:TonB family protein